MANKFQSEFLRAHKFNLKPSEVLSEMQELMPDLKTYRVFSVFKRAVLSQLSRGLPTPKDKYAVSVIQQLLRTLMQQSNQKLNGPTGISSYVVALGLGFSDSIYLARVFKSEYLLTQFLWRAFYYQADSADPAIRAHRWPINDQHQKAFYAGRTGYPLIDAAIVCLKRTGKMDNRLRMVVASFFCKNLLQPWMRGEKFFARYLEDYDEYVNRGNWIWCSQLRYDNQPFIRFFSPDLQLKKMLKSPEFKEWFSEWEQPQHVKIIDWKTSCERFRVWKAALRSS